MDKVSDTMTVVVCTDESKWTWLSATRVSNKPMTAVKSSCAHCGIMELKESYAQKCEELKKAIKAMNDLRTAQKNYMAVRDNKEVREPLGKIVAEMAEAMDKTLKELGV